MQHHSAAFVAGMSKEWRHGLAYWSLCQVKLEQNKNICKRKKSEKAKKSGLRNGPGADLRDRQAHASQLISCSDRNCRGRIHANSAVPGGHARPVAAHPKHA